LCRRSRHQNVSMKRPVEKEERGKAEAIAEARGRRCPTTTTTPAIGGAGFLPMRYPARILYDLLLSNIQLRKAENTPLTTLRIDHRVIRAEAGELEKAVCNFGWDHNEGDDENENDSDYNLRTLEHYKGCPPSDLRKATLI
jgi:hypothetical protein